MRMWQACLWGVQVLHGVLQGAPWEPQLGQGSKGNKEAGKGWVACVTKTSPTSESKQVYDTWISGSDVNSFCCYRSVDLSTDRHTTALNN